MGPVQPTAWSFTNVPLNLQGVAAVPPYLTLPSIVSFEGNTTAARLDLTHLPADHPPVSFSIHRGLPYNKEALGQHIHVLNRFVSRDAHAQVTYDPARGELIIMDVGSKNGTRVLCPHWQVPVDICAAGLAIFVGRASPAIVTLETGDMAFLKILAGGQPESLPPPSSFEGRVIYGIAHRGSPEELALVKENIATAYRAGARSIGLELPDALLPGRSCRRVDVFSEIAEYAQQLGMRVIPLLDDSFWDRVAAVDQIKKFITDNGEIDRQALARRIKLLKQEILDNKELIASWSPQYRAPEMQPENLRASIEELNVKLEQLKIAQAVLTRINYDMDAWSREWKAVMKVVDEMMKRRIQSFTPDVVVIGGAHARGAANLKGYRMEILRSGGAIVEGRRLKHPHLSTALGQFFEETLDGALELVGQHLASMVSGLSMEAQFLELLDEAVRIEPKFLPLMLRAFSDLDRSCLSYLMPGYDIEFLKIPVAEAKRRVEAALGQCANL